MDQIIFHEYLEKCQVREEDKSYLEIFNYSDPELSSARQHSLSSADDFDNFLVRKGVFAPIELKDGVSFTDGFRLVMQLQPNDPGTFAPDTISLTRRQYSSLVREMRLPLREIETTSAVGPFFWWKDDRSSAERTFQMIFRKSDVQWKGHSRGWEVMLSYSFETRITSGYVKATTGDKTGATVNVETTDARAKASVDVDFQAILRLLGTCARPVSHPFLLPILILNDILSPKHEQKQREARDILRQVENGLTLRYPIIAAEGYKYQTEYELDALNRTLADLQCGILGKRPQTWQNAIARMKKALEAFWGIVPVEEKTLGLEQLNQDILERLAFFSIKLENLENYIHVTLERLNIQRHVMDSIINQRESRLSLKIASQQSRIADIGRREGKSMKILTLLGSIFLPGTFLSSIFSMTFFNFDPDLKSHVSSWVWLYVVLAVPFTVFFIGLWWILIRRTGDAEEEEEDDGEADGRMNKIEEQILRRIRNKTGAKVTTNEWDRPVNA